MFRSSGMQRTGRPWVEYRILCRELRTGCHPVTAVLDSYMPIPFTGSDVRGRCLGLRCGRFAPGWYTKCCGVSNLHTPYTPQIDPDVATLAGVGSSLVLSLVDGRPCCGLEGLATPSRRGPMAARGVAPACLSRGPLDLGRRQSRECVKAL
jgi:hypothetical protein